MSFWDAHIAGGNKSPQPSTPQAQNNVTGYAEQPQTQSPYSGNYQQDWQNFVQQQGYDAAQGRSQLPQWVDQFNQAHPGSTLRATGREGDYDTINWGTPYDVDVITSGNQWWWGPEGPQTQANSYTGDRSQVGGGAYAGSNLTYSPWQQDPRNQPLYDLLMGRATQSLVPTADNPVIKAQTDAYRAEQERGSRNYLNDLAEKNGPYANNSTEARMAHEQAAQNTANMQGTLLQNEVNARRSEIQNALTEMGGLLSDDQRLALQKELGYLQNDQFLKNLGLQAEDRASYWDALRSGLIGG